MHHNGICCPLNPLNVKRFIKIYHLSFIKITCWSNRQAGMSPKTYYALLDYAHGKIPTISLRLFSITLLKFLFPTGTGKGGKSIWGKKFADELSPSLRVSMDFRSAKVPTQHYTLILLCMHYSNTFLHKQTACRNGV